MTAQETAELKVVVRWLQAGAIAAIIAAFSFGVWVATLQSQVARVPQLEAQIAEGVRAAHRLTARVDSLIIVITDRERRR